MTPGDLDLVQVVISWCSLVSASALIITRDERRLTGLTIERAWPVSSRNAAIYQFSPVCVAVHFVRTRRSLRGVALALAWTAAVVLVDVGLQAAAAAAIDGLGL